MKLREMHRHLRAALQARPGYPIEIRDFELTKHELAVLQALVCLLEDDSGALLQYTVSPTVPSEHRVTSSTFTQYYHNVGESALSLKWALLLHDIAKGRLPAGAHPEQSAGIVEELAADIQNITPVLNSTDLARVVWLVRYHDVLGNIYTGERAPSYLLTITKGTSSDERQTRLRLLQVVTLCDILGTNEGKYLTEEKTSFWLRLSDEETIDRLDDQLFDIRVARWTGNLLGIEDKKRASRLLDMIAQSGSSAEIRRTFGQYIDYIVYGFYLFVALSQDRLEDMVELMRKITDAYGRAFGDNKRVTVRFTPYKPWEASMQGVLNQYKTHIRNGTLRCDCNTGQGDMVSEIQWR